MPGLPKTCLSQYIAKNRSTPRLLLGVALLLSVGTFNAAAAMEDGASGLPDVSPTSNVTQAATTKTKPIEGASSTAGSKKAQKQVAKTSVAVKDAKARARTVSAPKKLHEDNVRYVYVPVFLNRSPAEDPVKERAQIFGIELPAFIPTGRQVFNSLGNAGKTVMHLVY